MATVRDAVESLPGRVVQHGAAAAPAATLAERRPMPFEAVTADREQLPLEPLDLATTVPFGPLVLSAHAVPRELCATNGLRFRPDDPEAAASLFLVRAVELCGIVRIDDCLTVVDEAAVRDLAKDVEFVSADLDRTPLVLPEGGGSQLLHMRTLIAALLPQRDELARPDRRPQRAGQGAVQPGPHARRGADPHLGRGPLAELGGQPPGDHPGQAAPAAAPSASSSRRRAALR